MQHLVQPYTISNPQYLVHGGRRRSASISSTRRAYDSLNVSARLTAVSVFPSRGRALVTVTTLSPCVSERRAAKLRGGGIVRRQRSPPWRSPAARSIPEEVAPLSWPRLRQRPRQLASILVDAGHGPSHEATLAEAPLPCSSRQAAQPDVWRFGLLVVPAVRDARFIASSMRLISLHHPKFEHSGPPQTKRGKPAKPGYFFLGSGLADRFIRGFAL